MDLAENTTSDPTVHDKLDSLEKTLFTVGQKARIKLNNWLTQTGMQLQAAEMVTNHKKRKLVHMEDHR